jgi:hypothetical protein
MKTITVEELQIGDTFRWMPDQWYGAGRLTHKHERRTRECNGFGRNLRFFDVVTYDLKFDAAVVNPPGIVYGVPAKLKIKLVESAKPTECQPTPNEKGASDD